MLYTIQYIYISLHTNTIHATNMNVLPKFISGLVEKNKRSWTSLLVITTIPRHLSIDERIEGLAMENVGKIGVHHCALRIDLWLSNHHNTGVVKLFYLSIEQLKVPGLWAYVSIVLDSFSLGSPQGR